MMNGDIEAVAPLFPIDAEVAMKISVGVKLAQTIVASLVKFLSLRPAGKRIEGRGKVEEIASTVKNGLLVFSCGLLFRRAPDVGKYSALEVVDANAVELLIFDEFKVASQFGINLLDVSGKGGLVLYFDDENEEEGVATVDLLVWGNFLALGEKLRDVLLNMKEFGERR